MKTNHLKWLFVLIFAASFLMDITAGPLTLGISMDGSHEDYRIEAGTAPWALALSLVIAGLYLVLMHAPCKPAATPMPGLIRRWFAFLIDFFLAMLVFSPHVGLLAAFAEWKRTGNFAWSFTRTVAQPGDTFILAFSILLIIIGVVCFCAVPLFRNRPSPGSCIAGYQVIAAGNVPLTLRKAILRTLVGFIAVSAPYLAPFLNRDRQSGQFWLDEAFETKAVKLE